MLELCLQIIHNIKNNSSNSTEIKVQINKIVELLSKSLMCGMKHSRLGWLKQSIILIDSLVDLYLHFHPHFVVTEINSETFPFVRYFYLNSCKEDQIHSALKVS